MGLGAYVLPCVARYIYYRLCENRQGGMRAIMCPRYRWRNLSLINQILYLTPDLLYKGATIKRLCQIHWVARMNTSLLQVLPCFVPLKWRTPIRLEPRDTKSSWVSRDNQVDFKDWWKNLLILIDDGLTIKAFNVSPAHKHGYYLFVGTSANKLIK